MKRTEAAGGFCFVETRKGDDNNPNVKEAYNYVSQDRNRVENMYKAMSLSPKVIKPIHDLYLVLLHDDDSPFEHWVAELLSVQVAIMNKCSYAFTHHSTNLHNFINDKQKSDQLIKTLENGDWADVIEDRKLIAMLDYGHKLCSQPDLVNEADIESLRFNGLSDKEIVFLAQINSAFAYWTRILNALGVDVSGEPIGLS